MRIVIFGIAYVGVSLILAGQALPNRDLGIRRVENQRAFIVGNESYLKTPLRTPTEDARRIAQALTDASFSVDLVLNADRRALEREIDKFIPLINRDDVVVVYYAGYAIQIGGENYLVPVDFDAKDVVDAKYTSYAAARLADRIEAAGAKICVLIIDGTAKNDLKGSEPGKTGLAPMSLSGKTYVVMASAPGTNSVQITDSRVGLFAGFLVDALETPGLTLDQIFGRVREKVFSVTNGAQVPVTTVGGDSSYVIRAANPSPDRSTDSGAFEKEFKTWNSIKDKLDEQNLREFVDQYPSGSFSGAANARLQSFISKGTSAPGEALISTKTGGNTNPKMAKLPDREVDPNFEFTEIEWELLSQCNALDRRYEREGFILNDPELNAYLDRVGRSILPSATPPPNVRWRFSILRDPVPNAFALANGSVYVNAGLLSILDNESQLASVLAHEITHVTGRHGFRSNRDYRKKALTASIAQMVANYAPGNSNWGASIKLAASAIPGLMQASILGYAREMERQADLFALQKLSSTGYDPREMVNVFRHLDEKPEVELQQSIYYGDHPKLQDRISYVNGYLADHKVDDNALFSAQAAEYRKRREKGVRADIQLAIGAGRRRTAYLLAKRLVAENPSADNLYALAETYRALGPWTPEVQSDELSSKAKKEAAKMKSKLTPEEEEAKYLASPQGQANLKENGKKAEDLYKKVLDLEPTRTVTYKALGLLYESEGSLPAAREAYDKYLAVSSDAAEAERIRHRLGRLEERSEYGKKGR